MAEREKYLSNLRINDGSTSASSCELPCIDSTFRFDRSAST